MKRVYAYIDGNETEVLRTAATTLFTLVLISAHKGAAAGSE